MLKYTPKMKGILLILFLFTFNLVSAAEADTIINLRTGGPEKSSVQKSESESYKYHVALSIDVFNFLTSKAYVSAEVPLSKLNSIVAAYGNYVFEGINVTNTSTKIKSKYEREQVFGLGFRQYLPYIETKEKTPYYLQAQIFTGNALKFNNDSKSTYYPVQYKAAALNFGYLSIKHRGLFYGFDGGIGVENVQISYFWYRIGFEAGFAF